MPMEQALVARLAAAVGDSCVSWFGVQRGDNNAPTYPASALTAISPGEQWTHEGVNGIAHPRVQVDHYSRDADDVAARAQATKAAMRQQADVADGSGGTIRFHPAMSDGEQWIDEGEQDGGQPLFRISQDFLFYFEEID